MRLEVTGKKRDAELVSAYYVLRNLQRVQRVLALFYAGKVVSRRVDNIFVCEIFCEFSEKFDA